MASTTGPDGHGQQGYDQQGHDQQGYDQQGHDRQGYGNPYGQPTAAPKNGAGIAALILGILSILLCLFAGLGLLPGLIGIVLGIVGLRRVRRGRATNRGSALFGVVTSVIGTVVSLVVAVVLAVVVGAAWNTGGRELVSCVRDSGSSEAAIQRCLTTYDQRVDDLGSINP